MKKLIILSTLITTIGASAIETPKTVYAEAGVNGIASTLNTEVTIIPNLQLRAGLGLDGNSNAITMPISMYKLWGPNEHKFELGATLQPTKYSQRTGRQSQHTRVHFIPSIGYRFMQDNGLLVRATYSLDHKTFSSNADTGTSFATPFNSISLGYTF